MPKINTDQNDIPAWMVWSTSTSGNTNLNAICLDHSRATSYRKTIAQERNVIKAWVEETRINHLYASLFEIPSNEKVHQMAKQIAALYEKDRRWVF